MVAALPHLGFAAVSNVLWNSVNVDKIPFHVLVQRWGLQRMLLWKLQFAHHMLTRYFYMPMSAMLSRWVPGARIPVSGALNSRVSHVASAVAEVSYVWFVLPSELSTSSQTS